MAKKKARKQLKYASVCDRKWRRLRLLPSVDVGQAKDTARIVPGTRRLKVTYGCMTAPRCVEQLVSRLRWFAASGGKLELVALNVGFPEATGGASERGTIKTIDLVQPARLELHVGPVDDARLGRILSRQESPMTLSMWCAIGATGAFLELAQPAPPLEVLTVGLDSSQDNERECWATVGAGLRGLRRYPHLCAVKMTSLNFTDESAIALAKARGLREVKVDVHRLTSKGAAALAAVRGLRQLILHAPIDDSICRILAKNDTIVDLEVGSITRRCLPRLAKMKSLRFRKIHIPDTRPGD